MFQYIVLYIGFLMWYAIFPVYSMLKFYAVSCHIISYHIVLYYVVSDYVIWFNAMLGYTMSQYIVLCCGKLYFIV